MTGKWTFNNTYDGNWSNDKFETKEEAIAGGLAYAKEDEWNSLFVGQVEENTVPNPIDSDDLLVRASEMLDEDGGSEFDFGDCFVNHITDEQEDDLQSMLEETYYKWVEKHNIKTHSWTINHTEEIMLADGEQP